ncbi:flagellar hook-basal body complex protein FliE [Arenibaculum pallidiluteum]|uniref:flagellar hook-basal body complex protein FliE n=1 Tax=Arenibaculum pallidiluteum TaxID=2812559 RepID=UPI001A96C372|nr:flagellar hook-basal body complex protein FliE [Arenibaculum pallidiluteum]
MLDISIGRVAAAYAANRSANVGEALALRPVAPPAPAAAAETDFGAFIDEQISRTVQTVQKAEKASLAAVAGKASTQEVVQAVMAAEVTLQTVVAIRDRMVQAYQDLTRMPI